VVKNKVGRIKNIELLYGEDKGVHVDRLGVRWESRRSAGARSAIAVDQRELEQVSRGSG